jgi:hypothetical protein
LTQGSDDPDVKLHIIEEDNNEEILFPLSKFNHDENIPNDGTIDLDNDLEK